MRKVKVLFFGATADAVGKTEIEVNVEAQTKSADVFRKIVAEFPELEKHSLLFAVNEEYASADKIIQNGDELAIFTAVSGG